MAIKSLQKNRHIFLFGLSLAVLLLIFKWLQLRFIIINYAFETYVLGMAVLFTSLGGWLAVKLVKPKVKTVVVEKAVFIEKEPDAALNEKEIEKLNLSKREIEILQLMAEGLTNNEIAARLFLSLNTIKTHSSRIFEKMDVERRTQAISKAKKLNIIP